MMAVTLVIPLTPIYSFTSKSVSAAAIIQQPKTSLKEGSYLGTQTVRITSGTKGAVIYYTINGSRPNTKSLKYSKPIKVNTSCVIRAIAIKNSVKSEELTNYYYIYNYADISDDVERFKLAIKKNEINHLNETDQRICIAVQKIISEIITNDMTDYDKIKAVHDYIIKNCSYDSEHEDVDTIPEASFSIEGVILNGTAVCQGYAETFQLFMDLLNITNLFVTGTGSGVAHAWNMVQINDSWYQVDTTWDDPTSESGNQTLRYNYFLINDTQMALDHVWIKDDYPACNNYEMMYKYYENNIISSISEYQTKFNELYNQGMTTITILYPENDMPNLNLYPNITAYSLPVKYGDYYMFTVYTK